MLFGVDGLSLLLLLLTLFVFPMCYLAVGAVQKLQGLFTKYLFSMQALLLFTFATLNLFYFFVFFEALLIPMLLLIVVWGARERKIKAGYYFFFYTLFGSIGLLVVIVYFVQNFGLIAFKQLETQALWHTHAVSAVNKIYAIFADGITTPWRHLGVARLAAGKVAEQQPAVTNIS